MKDQKIYTSFDEIPVTLSAEDVASVLGISRANAYRVMRRADFPVLQIGSRLLVNKTKVIEWMEAQERPT